MSDTGSEWMSGTTASAVSTYSGGPACSSSSLPYMPPHTQKKPMTIMPMRPTLRSCAGAAAAAPPSSSDGIVPPPRATGALFLGDAPARQASFFLGNISSVLRRVAL